MSQDSTLTTFETPYGPFVIDTKRDHKMAQVFTEHAFPNADLHALAKKLMPPNALALDIGAHIGTFAVPLCTYAQSVIAFEPNPESFAILSQNAEHHSNLELRSLGLGSKPARAGTQSRNDANAGAYTLSEGDAIEISTLDTEVHHADFIKIDVEGMELQVLRGGEHLLDSSHPTILCEVNLSQLRAHKASPKALQGYLLNHNYTLYFPLFDKNDAVRLSRIWSLSLLTFFIAPRATLTHVESAPFDIVAIAKNATQPLPLVGFWAALLFVLAENIRIKIRRARKLFS